MKLKIIHPLIIIAISAPLLFNSIGIAFANVPQKKQLVGKTLKEQLTSLEIANGGRIGLATINTGNGQIYQYRANERFPTCSTFKWMVAAAILKHSESHPGLLQQRKYYSQRDIDAVNYAPITQHHIKDGMTVSDLAAAAMRSDSGAANFLTKQLGGPKAVNAFARSVGNKKFNLVRLEPELNSAIPGDLRDTTTPLATVKTLQKVVLGNVLKTPQRRLLKHWLKTNTTGDNRIRAGVPKGWAVGDKTGTCGYGTTNDIGIIWPVECAPIILAIYYTQDSKNAKPKESVLAKTTRIVLNEIAKDTACVGKLIN